MNHGDEETKSQELVIIRRGGRSEEPAHHGGVWKIAYADFMTAMMAFFLVMWLINATDKKTLTQVATYFNPMRLTDKTASARGVYQMENSTQGDEKEGDGQASAPGDRKAAKENKQQKDRKAKGAPKTEEGKADAPKTEAGKAEAGKGTAGDEAMFQDPYAALAKIARDAPLKLPSSGAGEARTASGEAFRDPFDPAFRREAEADKSKAHRGEGGDKVAPAGAGHASASGPVEHAGDRAGAVLAQAAAAERLEQQIKDVVAQSLTGTVPNIDVTVTDDGILISLTDGYDFGMFAIASAEPRPAMVVVMERLAKVLAARSEPLVVRGHTDGRPYKGGSYDNWRLSTARAHMAYYMLVRGGIDEKRFERVEGYADRSLRVPHDPEAAPNRRIEILLRKAKA